MQMEPAMGFPSLNGSGQVHSRDPGNGRDQKRRGPGLTRGPEYANGAGDGTRPPLADFLRFAQDKFTSATRGTLGSEKKRPRFDPRPRICKWSRRWDLNPRPADYESAALPLSYAGYRQFGNINQISRLDKTTLRQSGKKLRGVVGRLSVDPAVMSHGRPARQK